MKPYYKGAARRSMNARFLHLYSAIILYFLIHVVKSRPSCAILSLMPKLDSLSNLLQATLDLFLDAVRFIRLTLQRNRALAAENLFLRKQLALYLERQLKLRRARDATLFTLVLLSRLFAWRGALTIVKPDTFMRWHRKGFRLFWKWKSKPRGRSRVPAELQKLIAEMGSQNPTWGEERIAVNCC